MAEVAQPPPNGEIEQKKGPPLIEVILRRHPQETSVERLTKEYIRTSQDVTVEMLKMFLGKKLGYSPSHHFQVRDGNQCCVCISYCVQYVLSNFNPHYLPHLV